MLIPVSLSEFIIDLCIGVAPRHLGSNDACIFIKPSFGISRNFFEISCPYATTITISGFNFLKNSNSSAVFKFFGFLTINFRFLAHLLTGEIFSFCPLLDFV